MLTCGRWLAGLLITDVVAISVAVFSFRSNNYEQEILSVYAMGGIVLLQVGLCIMGYVHARRKDRIKMGYVYMAHLCFSVLVFLAAELGMFR
jgi:hypothetical protein